MTPFHRFQVIIRSTRPVQLPPHQGAVIYALICAVNQAVAREKGAPKSFPNELMTDVPEVCRTQLYANDRFAFGGTILATDSADATSLLKLLQVGLDRLGREGKPRTHGLGGNFRIVEVRDLVADSVFSGQRMESLSATHLDSELQRILDRDELTVEFQSPIRIERPRRKRTHAHGYLDEKYFSLTLVLKMLIKRMKALGVCLQQDGTDPAINSDTVQLLDRRIQWLDMAYGSGRHKKLGGMVDTISIRVTDPVIKAALVWGQYTRLGKNTTFGFGRYRLRAIGSDPFACRRAIPLLNTAWGHPEADRISRDSGLEPGVLQHAIEQVHDGTYHPHPVSRIKIGKGEKQRTLQIPSRRDRALQRLVLEAVGPGCDRLFESSSFAWRRGLGRHNSAKAVQRAWQEGYRYAINADFDRFFESIPHDLVEHRLRCYVNDADTVRLVMLWVRTAVQAKDADTASGLPTGAPLSPLLGNLVLDRFDEVIVSQGARLVRYGDDFLILCRDLETAKQMYYVAREEAEELRLALNEAPIEVIDFDEPFRFLGFDFERHERWVTAGREPKQLEELGWHDASPKPQPKFSLQLPGETGQPADDFGLTAIVGPEATHLEIRPDALGCHYRSGRSMTSIPLADLETLIVLGNIGISSIVLQRLAERQIQVILAQDSGHTYAAICGDHEAPHDVVVAQADAVRSPQRTLSIATQLVVSKIHNYGRLAAELKGGQRVAQRLAHLAKTATEADSLDSLRGREGAAAAAWYQSLSGFLGKGFFFDRRVAPNAHDPVNVLLNIAHTHLYRLNVLAIRSAGLCSSLGFLHVPTGRFSALASDLQESFRFLMDRCVIEATWRLKPGDFVSDPGGPYALKIKRQATRRFQRLLWKTLHLDVRLTSDQDESTSYLVQMQRQARRLRRHLLHPEQPFPGVRLP